MANHLQSSRYLKWIRDQPCCHTGGQAEPHHIIQVGMGKTGGKAADIHAMPLCRGVHEAVHREPGGWPQIKWLLETQEKAFREGVLKIG
jgi:hypothetical protein